MIRQLAWNERQADFRGGVILHAAEIGELLDMRGSVFGDSVDLERAKIGRSLLMRSGAKFLGSVVAHGAEIQGAFDIRGSHFEQNLDLSSVCAWPAAMWRRCSGPAHVLNGMPGPLLAFGNPQSWYWLRFQKVGSQ